jgi:hypothetical protein
MLQTKVVISDSGTARVIPNETEPDDMVGTAIKCPEVRLRNRFKTMLEEQRPISRSYFQAVPVPDFHFDAQEGVWLE